MFAEASAISQRSVQAMHEHEQGEQQFDAAAQAAEWDARYSESDGAMWSGRPNGRLVAEIADVDPGRALDVGCGEGADAIGLARRGWTVTAIDISDVAIVGRERRPSSSVPRSSGCVGTRCRPCCRRVIQPRVDAVPGAAEGDRRGGGADRCSTRCARAGCCSPSTTTSTTNIAST